MSHARGLVTIAEALQQVFNVPVNASYRPSLCAGLRLPATYSRARHLSTTTPCSVTFRPYVAQSDENRPFGAREVNPSKYGPKTDRPPRDEEIRAWRVHLRLPNGKLSEPKLLQDALAERAKDEKGKYLQFVQELAAADPAGGRPYSIVGFFDKKEVKEKELAAKKKMKGGATKEKSLELSWSIGENDLQHRMGRLKEFLEKGSRVEVVFGSTRIRGWGMKRKITEEEGNELLKKIKQTALEVQGTKVYHELSGALLGQARITFQGPGKKEREASGDNEEEKQDK